MERRNVILKTLDNQPRIVFWSLDEFLIMALPLVVGLLFKGFLGIVVMLSGFPLKKIYTRLLKGSKTKSIKSAAYWFLPKKQSEKLLGTSNLPDSSQRELLL